MSQSPGSFRPSELDGADSGQRDADLATALAMARELEAALPAASVAPSADFSDRVMAAVAREPAPRPAGFLATLRARPGVAGLVASVREAWAVVGSGPGRPMRARGLALAYVVAVLVIGTSITGVAGYGAAGALGLLDVDATPTPSVQETLLPSLTPSPQPEPTTSPSPPPTEPAGSAEPSGSVEPDGSSEPEESDDHVGATPAATPDESPAESDDSGPSPSPSGDDDDSPSGSDDSPGPSDTPKPSQTPN
ncbi:MAG: hypothetical protein AB1736_14630 [Chloroflexota bacterium]